jgi:hypothetical protein
MLKMSLDQSIIPMVDWIWITSILHFWLMQCVPSVCVVAGLAWSWPHGPHALTLKKRYVQDSTCLSAALLILFISQASRLLTVTVTWDVRSGIHAYTIAVSQIRQLVAVHPQNADRSHLVQRDSTRYTRMSPPPPQQWAMESEFLKPAPLSSPLRVPRLTCRAAVNLAVLRKNPPSF